MASTITDSPKSAPSNSPDRSASDDNNAKTETPTTPGSNQPVPLIAHRHLGVEWPLYIQKGQRRFGPNPNCTSKPSRGAEIFLGRLPPDCFEEEIFRFVASVIEVESMYEIRVMLDPVHRGLSRRFAFVQFVNKDVAIRAVEQLNGQTIRNGFPVAVKESVDNCKLFFGGLPRVKTRQEIFDEVSAIVEGVVSVTVYPSAADKSKNRGFAFIQFSTHQLAAQARQKFQRQNLLLWKDVEVQVDWAEPEKDVNEGVMSKVKVLFLRNLMVTTAEDTIQRAFSKFGTIERVKKLKDYAFVHFSERQQALDALEEMNGKELDGAVIEVQLAKPPPPKTKTRSDHVNFVPTAYPAAAAALQQPLLANGLGFDPIIYNALSAQMLGSAGPGYIPQNYPANGGQGVTGNNGLFPTPSPMIPFYPIPQQPQAFQAGMIPQLHRMPPQPVTTASSTASSPPVLSPPESVSEGRTQKKLRRNATGQPPKAPTLPHTATLNFPNLRAAAIPPIVNYSPATSNAATVLPEMQTTKLQADFSQQKLVELCQKAGYSIPIYNTNVIPLNMVSNRTVGNDATAAGGNGSNVIGHIQQQTMYLCDVVLQPSLTKNSKGPLPQVYHVRPDKLMPSLDDAKGYAAEYIMKELGEVLKTPQPVVISAQGYQMLQTQVAGAETMAME